MNRRAFLGALGAACSLPAFAGNRIQTLIVTGRDDHDWRGVTPLMRRYLEETGLFEVRVEEEFRNADLSALNGYDLVVLVYSDKLKEDRWSDRSRAVLLDFVRGGKGLVVYHHTTTAFPDWPEFAQLCGGNYYAGAHHADIHDFAVTVADREHPITHGLKKNFTEAQDELYANMKMQPQGSYHVLATAWDDHALYGGKSRTQLIGTGADEPVLWTVDAGKGRVFATMLGHDVRAVQNPGFRVTFTRGAEWAATGGVTQTVPIEFADAAPAQSFITGIVPAGAKRTDAERMNSFLSQCDDVEASGFHHIEFNDTNTRLSELYAARPADFAAELQKRHLRLTGLALYSRMSERSETHTALGKHVQMARFLSAAGAKYIAHMLDPMATENSDIDLHTWVHNANEIGRRMFEVDGVRLAYHPEMTEIRSGLCRRFLDATDERYVRLTADTGHIVAGGADAVAFCRDHAARLACVHLKDARAGQAGKISFGEGDADLPGVVKALRLSGYTGFVMAESGGTNRAMSDYLRSLKLTF